MVGDGDQECPLAGRREKVSGLPPRPLRKGGYHTWRMGGDWGLMRIVPASRRRIQFPQRRRGRPKREGNQRVFARETSAFPHADT